MAQSKAFDYRIDGLNSLLRDLRQLGPEAQKELRAASKTIAQNRMVPAFQQAALQYAGPWGEKLSESIKAGSDRLPKVTIGGARINRFSGGASYTMVRYPSDSGDGGGSFAPFERTQWLDKARSYRPYALQEWGQAVDKIIRKWAV